jgi:deferrochelatase/peroxidase EfeB
LNLAAFDLVAADRGQVADLLRAWTAAASNLAAGRPVASLDDNLLSPPADTGEAIGSGVARLTLTFGFGSGLFSGPEGDRYGLGSSRPSPLVDLPAFPGDQLDPARSGGDLLVQACADDPLVAFHAVHNLARVARGAAVLRWSQVGFGRTSSVSRRDQTPRNLMGFKDGTNNIQTGDDAAMAAHVWVGVEGPTWMRGGTYVVVRRIRMLLEKWDRSSLDEQQRTIGRLKYSGAPIGGQQEHDTVDLGALDASGHPVVPTGAHVREAAPSTNGGERILRRGYSFDDGVDDVGEQDVGLVFVCFQQDPRRQFVPIQRRLAANDGLNEYIRHTGSAVFAVPAGVAPGGWVGQSLFGT